MSEPESPVIQEETREETRRETPTTSALRDNVKSLAAGAMGGIFAVISGHPFDLLKVRCQSGQATSMSHAVREILHESRGSPIGVLRGFYRGVIPPLLGVTPIFAVSFWGYDVGKKIVAYGQPPTKQPLMTGQLATAGFISAIPTTLVMAPTERIKVFLQTKQGYTFISAAKRILFDGGIQSLFRGSLATLARDGPGSALYFAAYEVTKKALAKPGQEEFSVTKTCVAGGMAGVAMWTGVFPLDTIKTKLQAGEKRTSFKNAVQEIYLTRGGLKGFFPGLGPALLRSFPANAATFVGVEMTHAIFKKMNI